MIHGEQAQQRLGEALALVGDDAPGQLAHPDFRDQLGNPVEEPRLDAQLLFVEIEKAIAQRDVAFALGSNPETGFQQAARAARGVRARSFRGQGREALLGTHSIQRAGEIGSGVGKGTVQVEQNCADPGEFRKTVDPVQAQRIDLVERLELALRIPPAVRERAEFFQFPGVGVHIGLSS